ncbi:MAG: DNA topoisomerase IV [Flavobacteriaceae bacterium]|nr:DNA topoisomerase IV [Flavobacteriaceae bacterium]
MKKLFLFYLIICVFSCYSVDRDCKSFQTGTFESIISIDGKDYISTFKRNESVQIETFENKIDSAHVRWINDCEVIFKTINPKNRAEQKDIHLKILKTTIDSYTFEYSYVGEVLKQKGLAKRIH